MRIYYCQTFNFAFLYVFYSIDSEILLVTESKIVLELFYLLETLFWEIIYLIGNLPGPIIFKTR